MGFHDYRKLCLLFGFTSALAVLSGPRGVEAGWPDVAPSWGDKPSGRTDGSSFGSSKKQDRQEEIINEQEEFD